MWLQPRFFSIMLRHLGHRPTFRPAAHDASSCSATSSQDWPACQAEPQSKHDACSQEGHCTPKPWRLSLSPWHPRACARPRARARARRLEAAWSSQERPRPRAAQAARPAATIRAVVVLTAGVPTLPSASRRSTVSHPGVGHHRSVGSVSTSALRAKRWYLAKAAGPASSWISPSFSGRPQYTHFTGTCPASVLLSTYLWRHSLCQACPQDSLNECSGACSS
mmetsp:Transcript_48166/g.150772  ORF Transcript_48166/g.150772 Transcript_48166/m.150772 type:complete len:222 (+) Transcript_48166:440-1105(+)